MTRETQFRELFQATYATIARYGRNRGVSGADLQDLLADTYEVAWRRFDAVPAGDQSLPWLIGVARNHLRSHRRRLQRDRGLIERLGPPAVAEGADEAGDWPAVRRALGRLGASDLELVLLVAWDELSSAQAGAVLGISPGAARTRLHRARARLTAELDSEPSRAPRPMIRTTERTNHA